MLKRDTFRGALHDAFGRERVREHVALASYTTFRIGGPADWLIEVHDAAELMRAVRLAQRHAIPVTLLGGGSNVLVGDAGIRGLTLVTRYGGIVLTGEDRVRAEAGVTINGLVRWTITHGLAGLEAWAGTPGTVGGAVFGNAHFEGRLIGELVVRAALLTRDGTLAEAPGSAMEFGYDASRLQRTGEVLLWAEFRVSRGEPAQLREMARRSLAFRKRSQPLQMPSAGCIFQNPLADEVPGGLPASAGALIDLAGLKGHAVGAARVSPVHANFIVNEGGATARDVRALVAICQHRVRDRFGVALREEIVSLGEF